MCWEIIITWKSAPLWRAASNLAELTKPREQHCCFFHSGGFNFGQTRRAFSCYFTHFFQETPFKGSIQGRRIGRPRVPIRGQYSVGRHHLVIAFPPPLLTSATRHIRATSPEAEAGKFWYRWSLKQPNPRLSEEARAASRKQKNASGPGCNSVDEWELEHDAGVSVGEGDPCQKRIWRPFGSDLHLSLALRQGGEKKERARR